MKAKTWIKKPAKYRKWSFGLVRDTDGVIKVCEIFSHPFGYGIVGKSEISNKGKRLFPGTKNRILSDLFIGIGMYFGITQNTLTQQLEHPETQEGSSDE